MIRISKLGRVLVAVGAIALADGLDALTIDVQKARKDAVRNTDEIVTNVTYDLDLPYGSIGNAGLVQPLAVNSTNQSGIVFGNQGTIYINADPAYGLYRTVSGKLAVSAATWEDYEAGTSWYKPITPAIIGAIIRNEFAPVANREFLMISSDRSVALAKDTVESAYPVETSHNADTASYASYGFSVNLKSYLEEQLGSEDVSITKVRLQSVSMRLRNLSIMARVAVRETGTTEVLALSDPLQLSNASGGRNFHFLFTDNVVLDADKQYDFAVVDATTGDARTDARMGAVTDPVITGLELLNNDGTRSSLNGAWGGGITADCIGHASIKIATEKKVDELLSDFTVKSVKRNGTELTPDTNGAVDVSVPTKLNDVCPDTENWIGVPGTTAAGKFIKILAKTVNGIIEGGLTIAGSSNNDNNTTKYRYNGITVTRSGTAKDYLFDSSQSGIARFEDLSDYAQIHHTHTWVEISDRPTNVSDFTNDADYVETAELKQAILEAITNDIPVITIDNFTEEEMVRSINELAGALNRLRAIALEQQAK